MDAAEAIADPVRREIIGMLARGERTAGEIAARFPVSRPAISRHLRVLRESGIAVAREEATRRVYSLNPGPLDDLASWIAAQRAAWEVRADALGRYLDAMEIAEQAARDL